ncbi:MAG: hypothetical protein IJY93_10205 [Clostridia bacterium]|nr:hypothetical protein [Clostridia bacterium]
MIKTNINLVPDHTNPTPDYYCTWQTQLYASCDGKPEGQRAIITEKSIFEREKPYGWAYFYEKARSDLFFIMDDSWDVPIKDDPTYYGSLILNPEKFPECTKGRTNEESLKYLVDKMKALGWKGIGGWVCAQESEKFGEDDISEYWKKRLSEVHNSGFAYWKVDWGKKQTDIEFRKMLTSLAKEIAPNLVIEHAMVRDIIPHSDVFRTYDVPAIMSIPMTMQKLKELTGTNPPQENRMGLINCEDEAYIAAAGGFVMGIMRHPHAGEFVNGKKDMSFPEVHRNLKTKMYEIIRAARWHRMAPAFGEDNIYASSEELVDTWRFENRDEEMEAWWLEVPAMLESITDGVLAKKAPAFVCRGCTPPEVIADDMGNRPYVVASKNPNGAYSIATLGRTVDRTYEIPKCNITFNIGDADTVAVFGEYKNLILESSCEKVSKVLIQDLADELAYDITDDVHISENKISIPGELITKIGRISQPSDDTSEPGAVIKLI